MRIFQWLHHRSSKNPFSPAELACFLPSAVDDKNLKVVKRGEHLASTCSFKEQFGIPYFPHIRFASAEHLDAAIQQRPWMFRMGFLGMEQSELYYYYRTNIYEANTAQVTIAWIDEVLGYGLYASKSLKEGAFIGSYTGLVRPLSRQHPDHNVYCLHYPTRYWSQNLWVIDAGRGGNELRFANHSDTPNMTLECLYDRGLLFFFFRSSRPIGKGSPLTFDYGEAFWRYRMEKKLNKA